MRRKGLVRLLMIEAPGSYKHYLRRQRYGIQVVCGLAYAVTLGGKEAGATQ